MSVAMNPAREFRKLIIVWLCSLHRGLLTGRLINVYHTHIICQIWYIDISVITLSDDYFEGSTIHLQYRSKRKFRLFFYNLCKFENHMWAEFDISSATRFQNFKPTFDVSSEVITFKKLSTLVGIYKCLPPQASTALVSLN